MDRLPSRFDGLIFQVRAMLLRARRFWTDGRSANRPIKAASAVAFNQATLLAESRSLLWDRTAVQAEQFLQRGKVENLRVAARRLDLCVVAAESNFSFWRQVGRPARARGFVRGRELRQGCLIPSIGGGLCQLSNALYDAALQAGFRIKERHRHTEVVPGSLSEMDLDATVFWN